MLTGNTLLWAACSKTYSSLILGCLGDSDNTRVQEHLHIVQEN